MNFDLILRTSVLLASAALVSKLLARATAETRHLVWHSAVVLVLAAPLLGLLAPTIEIDFPNQSIAPDRVTSSAAPAPGSASTDIDLAGIARAGSVCVGLFFAIAWLASEIAVRRAKHAPVELTSEAQRIARKLGISSTIDVRLLGDDGTPQVAGLFRSVILLPASAAEWSPEDRQAALAHELTHIRRRDRRTQALAQAACALHWFNPLAWYAAAALSRERERACDAAALSLGARPSAYATLLLDLARRTRPAWSTSAALTMARPSAIEGRLLKILGSEVRAPWRTTRWLIAAGAVAISTVVLGAQQARPLIQQAKPAAERPATLLEGADPDQPASVTKAFVDGLQDDDRQVREKAAIGLAFTPGTAVIDPLLSALKDSDAQVREKAAIGLAFRRDPRIVAPLLQAIEDPDAQVREKAAIALGASGDDRAVAALTKAARDADSQVREKALAGLVLLGLRK